MIKNITPMGQIKHTSGYLFVVHYCINNDYVVAHPKYDLRGKKIKRISNPVDPKRNNLLQIENTVKFGVRDYIINLADVVEYYPCFNSFEKLENGTEKSAKIRKRAIELISLISNYIPKEHIGFTGSLATGNAIDNYSDIDLILYEKDYRTLISSDIWSENQQIVMRTRNEWREFYNHFGVLCALNSEEFAIISEKKKQQFIFNGIPVSIFICSDNNFLQLVNSLGESTQGGTIAFKGKVIYEDLVNLPGYALIETSNKVVIIINLHRTYQNSVYRGDYCEFNVKTSSFTDLYLVKYDDECYIKYI